MGFIEWIFPTPKSLHLDELKKLHNMSKDFGRVEERIKQLRGVQGGGNAKLVNRWLNNITGQLKRLDKNSDILRRFAGILEKRFRKQLRTERDAARAQVDRKISDEEQRVIDDLRKFQSNLKPYRIEVERIRLQKGFSELPGLIDRLDKFLKYWAPIFVRLKNEEEQISIPATADLRDVR